jgi:hypothetical protein
MPNWWSKFMRRITAAQKAFQKPDVITDPLDLDADWNEYGSRRNRYDIFWAFYENTVYEETQSNFHRWAAQYKTRYGMYKYSRNVYNPSLRLGDFWRSHIWGGSAEQLFSYFTYGDNVNEDQLLEAIAQIWQWSNWEIKKDIVPLYGSTMGDVAIVIVDDTERGKVFLDIVHPGNLVYVDKDIAGNVVAYHIEEERPDPRKVTNQSVVYTEIAMKVDDQIEYTTLLNGNPYAWNGVAEHWTTDYGFVPMVTIQHNDVGLLWGWSEILPGQSKFREVDDLGSKLNDQIRKTVDAMWFFAGATAPTTSPKVTEGTATANKPQPGREELPALYGPENATATALVADLEIEQTSNHIGTIIKEIEKDYPELRLVSLLNEDTGPVSGRALEAAKQPAIVKVQERRPNYYSAMIRANQMAVTIAGLNGYNGYNIDSFDNGELEHNIMGVPIFTTGEFETQELLKGKIEALKVLTDAGASLFQAARLAGFTEEEAAALNEVDISGADR